MATELKDHVRKFIPLLLNPIFKLQRSAEWLSAWISGTLPSYDLLDVSGFLGDFLRSKRGVFMFFSVLYVAKPFFCDEVIHARV